METFNEQDFDQYFFNYVFNHPELSWQQKIEISCAHIQLKVLITIEIINTEYLLSKEIQKLLKHKIFVDVYEVEKLNQRLTMLKNQKK